MLSYRILQATGMNLRAICSNQAKVIFGLCSNTVENGEHRKQFDS